MARVKVLAVATLVLAGACTAVPPRARPTPSVAPLSGTIVAVGGGTAALIRYALPGGTATSVVSPIGEDAANRGTFAGTPGPDGSAAFVTIRGGEARVWELPAGSAAPEGIGVPLRVATAEEPSLSIGNGSAAVATCSGVWSSAIGHRPVWARLGKSCWTAAGPSGEVAFSPDGDAVVSSRRGLARPSPLFRLEDLRRDLGTRSSGIALVGEGAWNPRAGLAFAVRAGDQLGVFVRTRDGRIVEAVQEPYANSFRAPRLAWQPGGGLLAIADDVGPGGSVLRLFDPAAAELRTVALDPLGFSGMAWAPDGTTIAILTGSSALLVVDPSGRWIERVKTDWKGLIAWTS